MEALKLCQSTIKIHNSYLGKDRLMTDLDCVATGLPQSWEGDPFACAVWVFSLLAGSATAGETAHGLYPPRMEVMTKRPDDSVAPASTVLLRA